MGRNNRTRSSGIGSPTLEVLAIIVIVFAVQWIIGVLGFGLELFALALPLTVRPWTVVTSVYAHGTPGHLLMNAVGLLIVGFLVERSTTRWRYHGFVLGTGVLAGVTEVVVSGVLGRSPLVLGISGAVFGLMGYLVSANPVTSAVLGRFEPSRRVQLVLVVVLAAGITILTAGEGVALVAHFTGFAVGLVAGRMHLLRVR